MNINEQTGTLKLGVEVIKAETVGGLDLVPAGCPGINPLIEYLKTHPYQGPFKPHPIYSKEGNFLTIHFTEDDCYCDPLVDGIDVYRHMETNEIVGVRIWGIRQVVGD